MKDSTVFILLGLLCMIWVLFCAVISAGLVPMAAFCGLGVIWLGFGLVSLANDQ